MSGFSINPRCLISSHLCFRAVAQRRLRMAAHMRAAPGVAETSIPARSFSLVGLLVVLTVLVLGFSLLVTSIGQAREAARRIQCSNNLKQIGLGIQNFHDIRQELP